MLDDGGSVVRALPMTNGLLSAVTWSPDGRWVAGFMDRGEPQFRADLWLFRADGGTRRRLVSAGVLALGSGSLYAWAPDGRTLAYSGIPTSAHAGSLGTRASFW